jgi:alkyldihydroxyacetonephosphate synthase
MKVNTYMSRPGTLPAGFLRRAREIVGEDHVSQLEADLISYSLDYWLYGVFLSQRGELPALPLAVVSPASSAEAQQLVRCANEYKVPITIFGGGSGVVGGAIPVHGSITLNCQRMSSFLSLDEVSLVAECEAGIMGANLELELNHRGYSAGNIPQSLYCSTLGGWIATRAAGQFSTKYGKIEDMILGMEVVLPDGSLLDIKPVPRRSVGPSLQELFLGSEGTLGIVTRATISIHPLPKLTVKQSFVFPSLETAVDVVRKIMRAEARPAVVRIFDEAESERYFPRIGRKVTTIFISEGEADYASLDGKTIRRIARQNGGKPAGEEAVNIWLEKRFDIGLGPVLMQLGGIVDTIEVSALFKDAAKLYRDMIASMKKVEGVLEVSGHYSHFYPQGACLYVTFAGLPGNPLRYYRDTWDAAMDSVFRNNGSISHHHGIGLWRMQYMERELGASGMRTLRSIKNALDPEGILNRGKLLDDQQRQGI